MNLVGISCPVGLEISKGAELWDLQGKYWKTWPRLDSGVPPGIETTGSTQIRKPSLDVVSTAL